MVPEIMLLTSSSVESTKLRKELENSKTCQQKPYELKKKKLKKKKDEEVKQP